MKRKYKIIFSILSVLIIALILVRLCTKNEEVKILKKYYPDTKVTDISEYIIKNGDTVLHGKFTQYNEQGIKIAEGNFLDNEPNGKSIYYFEKGNIKSVYYTRNSKIIEESTFYNHDGLIEKYVMYDDLGDSSFIISFDEKGVRKYDGHPILEIYQYKIANKEQFKTKINQYLKTGDILKYQYLIANIPNTRRYFKIENVGVDNTKIKRTITKIRATTINVEEVLIKKGINRINAIVQYQFNDKVTPNLNDTIHFEINVN